MKILYLSHYNLSEIAETYCRRLIVGVNKKFVDTTLLINKKKLKAI